MTFSGALTLTDLNDYLGPSQACIKPVEVKSVPVQQEEPDGAARAETEVSIDHDGSYYERRIDPNATRARTKLEAAEISLNDCLACSGCVTSAESVLITMQSHQEMRRAVEEQRQKEAGRHSEQDSTLVTAATEEQQSDSAAGHVAVTAERTLRVASISPQSLASLLARLEHTHQSPTFYHPQHNGSSTKPLPPTRVLLVRIRHFLAKHFDFHHTYDTTFARHIALREHTREFTERKRAGQEIRWKGGASALNAAANSLQRVQATNKAGAASSDAPTTVLPHQGLPMLASACPGWICYAEKTHGELLPFIASTKSPQQIAGGLAKRYLLPRSNAALQQQQQADHSKSFDAVYHVTVMPCYDKKLEASRQDFVDELSGWKEVDCVLTTGELEKLMTAEGFDLAKSVPDEEELLQQDYFVSEAPAGSLGQEEPSPDPDDSNLFLPSGIEHEGSSSGSYLFSLIRQIAIDWLQAHPHQPGSSGMLPQLETSTIRSADYTEFVLRAPPATRDSETGGGEVLFKGAQCYGFRNLQNLVRKLHRQTGTRSARGAAASMIDGVSVSAVDLINGDAKPAGRRAAGAARVNGRGGGMVRRNRLNGDLSASSSGTATPETQALAERGYDYIEVMACPSGCVNGGGQLRPPTSSTDADRALQSGSGEIESPAAPQNALAPIDPPIQGWQGTSKEWVAKVEQAYWPDTQTLGSGSDGVQAVTTKVRTQKAFDTILSRDTAAEPSAKSSGDLSAVFDLLAEHVINDAASRVQGGRPALLRTQYRALPTEETNGLAVQW